MNEEMFEQIESVKFAVNFTVISSLNIFHLALEENDILRQLIESLPKKRADQQKVFDRLFFLLESENNPEFLHPHDVAIAAYLHVLSNVDNGLASRVSRRVKHVGNLWWSRQLAASIQERVTSVPTITIEAGDWLEGIDLIDDEGSWSRIETTNQSEDPPSPRIARILNFSLAKSGSSNRTIIDYSAPTSVTYEVPYEKRVS